MKYFDGTLSLFFLFLGGYYTYHTGLNVVTIVLLLIGIGCAIEAYGFYRKDKMWDEALAEIKLEKKEVDS